MDREVSDDNEVEPLGADTPITSRDQDLLGYWPFAESLARGLTGRSPDEGFVIGVQARWGMGKTSAVNLIVEAIAEAEAHLPADQRTVVAYFNPWLFAGLEALATGYLKQLGQILDDSLGSSGSESAKNFVRKLLAGGGEFLGVAAAAGLTAVTHGVAAPVAGGVRGTVKKAAETLGAEKKKSVEDLLKEVRAALHKIPHRILLIVDDLDRLTPQELRQILTLLKTFGSLPKLTHLLVYDRKIVDAGLRSSLEAEESQDERIPSYREKIVQVEFDLPPPSADGLQRLVDSRLESALAGQAIEADKFWFRVWRLAYRYYLLSPRDVVRFMNALSITWPAVRGEVYPPDLIAIELLRHFERKTYEAIRSRGDYLTGRGESYGEDTRKAEAEAILASVDQSRAGPIGGLLAALFPTVARHKQDWGDAGPEKPLSGRRLRDPEGFAAFLGFAPVQSALSMDQRRTLAARIHDATYLRESLSEALDGQTPDGLSQAAPLIDSLTEIVEATDGEFESLLLVILEFADAFVAKSDAVAGVWLTIDNHERLRDVIKAILLKWPNDCIQDIRKVLLDPGTSLRWAGFVLGLLACPHGLIFRSEFVEKVDETWVRQLGADFVERVKAEAASKKLYDAPDLWLILRVWETFGSADEARAWVGEALADPRGAVALTMALGSFVRSTAEPHTYYRFAPDSVTVLLQPSQIIPAIKHHTEGGLIAKERLEALNQIIEGADNWLASKSGPDEKPESSK